MSVISPSISFHQLVDDADAVLDRIATNTGGIVISYEGNDIARITALGAEERAWRKTLVAEGEDPDAPENTMELHLPEDVHSEEADEADEADDSTSTEPGNPSGMTDATDATDSADNEDTEGHSGEDSPAFAI